VIHRDLKPENIMLGENGELKIIDFGLALPPKAAAERIVVGSAHYLAPDVICGKYNSKCDVWSLGVIMYILLSGYLPFSAENPKEIMRKIVESKVSFNQKIWEGISPEAQDLLKNMLRINTRKRFTAKK
jgi:calcium-dependent protein kinase